jgi:FAD/FMN-containing dehydrogenase
MVVLDSLDDAPALLTALRGLGDLDAVEVVLGPAARLVAEVAGLALPLPLPDGGAAVLVDCAGWTDPTDALAAAVGDRVGVLADGAQRTRLFDVRDHITTSINARAVPLKLDVAVPVERLAATVALTETALARHAPGAELFAFGHLAEGNLHLNVIGAGEGAAAITADVLGGVVALGGTISAEHGIGIAKVAWLERVKGPGTAGALRAIKRALDPTGMLNPGVLFDVSGT